jgi:hypothetical protein
VTVMTIGMALMSRILVGEEPCMRNVPFFLSVCWVYTTLKGVKDSL